MTTINPCFQMGRTVTGKWFVPRKHLANDIVPQHFAPGIASGNVHIVGLPHVGKTTLVYNEFILREKEFWQLGKITVLIEMSNKIEAEDNGSRFLLMLVEEVQDFLDTRDVIDSKLNQKAETVRKDATQWGPFVGSVEKYFKTLYKKGYCVTAVIDEFDATRKLFQNNPACLRAFRDLIYLPQYGISCIATSRRYIRDIEAQAHGGQSTLALVFSERCLSFYTEEEFNRFWDRFKGAIDETYKPEFLFYCGRHPFLLDAFGFQAWKQQQAEGRIDIRQCRVSANNDFLNCYNATLNLLDESNLYSKLVEVLIGPALTVEQSDIMVFQDLGLIVHDDETSQWRAYSTDFHEFVALQSKKRQTEKELWPAYFEAVSTLRKTIIKTLEANGEPSWQITLKDNRNDSVLNMLAECEDLRQKDIVRYGGMRGIALKDYLDMPQFSIILNTFWKDRFDSIFGKSSIDKKTLNRYITAIITVRNPTFHSRGTVCSKADIDIATGYCSKLIEACKNHESLS